jgi:hypothetical protein
MILGYPGKTTEDVEQSIVFLQLHAASTEPVSLNRLQVIAGTVETMDLAQRDRRYRRASDRLIAQVQAINRRPLSGRAQDFDGVM